MFPGISTWFVWLWGLLPVGFLLAGSENGAVPRILQPKDDGLDVSWTPLRGPGHGEHPEVSSPPGAMAEHPVGFLHVMVYMNEGNDRWHAETIVYVNLWRLTKGI